ncbi:MAG: S9 family peptidase [Planctomycetales bacterium]|nr:S9 family peptidase [Planctomycetales bacterium]
MAFLSRWLCIVGLVVMTSSSAFSQDSTSGDGPRLSDVSADEDPYLWLEGVEDERALDWVRARNGEAQAELVDDAFAELESELLAILDSDARIPSVSKRGDWYYNFWRDKEHPRGIWRRTTLEEYRKESPDWEILLDLDAVSEAEGENWVWSGASGLKPNYDRWLISLSRGGADATVTREFDLPSRSFVADGFQREEAKGSISWIDLDHVYVATDFGPGSMTDSGYPRVVKRWTRGTPMADADVIYEGTMDDMRVGAYHDDSPGFEREFVYRALAFYNDELYWINDSGELVQVDVPNSANKDVVRQYLMLELREPWEVEGTTYAAGSLLATNFDAFMQGGRKFDVLFEPTERTSLAGYSATKDHFILNVMEDVKNRLYVVTATSSGWRREPLVGAPDFGTVSAGAVDSDESNAYWMTVTDYLTPTSLFYGEIGEQPEKLKSLPAFFDAEGLAISQHFATSADGTQVPYFMVAREDVELNGDNPTLLYGYGGFEISLTPSYSASVGRAWLLQGGVYVVANIRGGGEYGPRWHQAALKANRLRAYEDFAAVGQDLIKRGVTTSERLGIQGGSNGGLLVGNMVTRYPDLFAAAVCQVPLLDMKRYHRLLAGASWMAEYGDPDDAEQWEFIQTYSPYQMVRADKEYPTVFFTTSTRDDRVHPGHARKMMARMFNQGHSVLYYENIEGGHGGAANNQQRAYMSALAFRFLQQQLMGEK